MPRTFYASREQLVDSEDARGSASGIALGASLLLHLVILGLIFFKQRTVPLTEAPPPKVAMVITISSTNPQLKPPSPVVSADIDAENPVLEISPAQQIDDTEEETAIDQETEVHDQAAIEQASSPPSAAVTPDSELEGNQLVGNSGAPGISKSEVNNSVSAYIADYRSSLTGDWLSSCVKYQNGNGGKACPRGEEGKSETIKTVNAATAQLFTAYVSGADANVRASKRLREEMEAVRPYMNENSVMGELARQRYQLAEANYCQLNSCRTFALNTNASFATPITNEGSIVILRFGAGGGPSIVGGLMSLLAEPKPQAVKPVVPYRFTTTPDQQDESEDDFKVEAALFPIRR